MPAEEPLERAVAEDVTVAGESRAKLLHGDVRRLFEKALDQRALRLDAGGAAIYRLGVIKTVVAPPESAGLPSKSKKSKSKKPAAKKPSARKKR